MDPDLEIQDPSLKPLQPSWASLDVNIIFLFTPPELPFANFYAPCGPPPSRHELNGGEL